MSDATPVVSVVIPTHDRLSILHHCLEALEQQRYPKDRLEIIVVADGCSDGTAESLSARSLRYPLRVVAQEARGAAAARNRGAREARGPMLLFLDDDVVASPGLVDAHVRAQQTHGDCFVVGPYLPAQPQKDDYLGEALYEFWFNTFANMADSGRQPGFKDLLSGNLSVPAHLFAGVGGFDPGFRRCGLEDYELGVRVIEQRERIVFAPEAHAKHLDTTDLQASLARHRQEGNAAVLLVELHPCILPQTRLNGRRSLGEWLALRSPALGDFLAEHGRRLLLLLQWVRCRRSWRSLYRWLIHYSFWRGVAGRIQKRGDWRAYLERIRRRCRS